MSTPRCALTVADGRLAVGVPEVLRENAPRDLFVMEGPCGLFKDQADGLEGGKGLVHGMLFMGLLR